MGPLSTFLGVKFDRREHGAVLSQAHYVREILQRFEMENCKSISTPMAERPNVHIKSRISTGCADETIDQDIYREAIGSLLYLSTKTRPDISFAVNMLARSTQNPTALNWVDVKRVLRYLKGTGDFCLRLSSSEGELRAFSD